MRKSLRNGNMCVSEREKEREKESSLQHYTSWAN
jgi:hypothetical protein